MGEAHLFPYHDWRLVVLGIAQDGGVPHLGCEKGPRAAVRRGERPAEKVACLGIGDGERAFLSDATPDLPAQVQAMGVRLPSGVFLTHAHICHYTGLVHLGKEVAGTHGVPVWATGKMRGFISANAPWSGDILRDSARDARAGAAARGPVLALTAAGT